MEIWYSYYCGWVPLKYNKFENSGYITFDKNTAYTEKMVIDDSICDWSPVYTHVQFDVNSWDAATISELGIVSYTTGETSSQAASVMLTDMNLILSKDLDESEFNKIRITINEIQQSIRIEMLRGDSIKKTVSIYMGMMNVDKMFTSSTFYEEAWQDSVPTLSTSFNNGITCKYKLDTTESSEDCIYDRLSYYNGLFYYPSGEMYCWDGIPNVDC